MKGYFNETLEAFIGKIQHIILERELLDRRSAQARNISSRIPHHNIESDIRPIFSFIRIGMQMVLTLYNCEEVVK